MYGSWWLVLSGKLPNPRQIHFGHENDFFVEPGYFDPTRKEFISYGCYAV